MQLAAANLVVVTEVVEAVVDVVVVVVVGIDATATH